MLENAGTTRHLSHESTASHTNMPDTPPSTGWFRVARKLTNAQHDLHPSNTGEVACKLAAWVDLIGMAQYEDNGELERGQLQASLSYLGKRWNWLSDSGSTKRVRVFLKMLEDEDRIARHHPGGRAPTVITIVNYDQYQAVPEGHKKGHIKGQEKGRIKGTLTPQALGENPSPGAHKGHKRGHAKGQEKGQQDNNKKNREETTQADSAPRKGAAPTSSDQAQPTLLDHPEEGPEPDTVDRIVKSWHQTIVDAFNDVKGGGSGSRLKLTDNRRSRIRDLVEMGYDCDDDLKPAVRQVLHSDYWKGKGGSRQYMTLLRKGGENLEMYRDKWHEKDSSTGGEDASVDSVDDIRAERRERLQKAREELGID